MLFVHSPMLGPSSWASVAELAARARVETAVPDLTGVVEATPPLGQWLVDTAATGAQHLPEPVVVVGHSGAGVFLPSIGEALDDRLGALVFVDAVVPAHEGSHRTPPELAAMLDEHTADGRLALWLDWWPAEVVGRLLPDTRQRAALLADMPRLPRSLYDEAVAVPDGWSDLPCAYVMLSAAYEADRADAARRGWPHVTLDGQHLSPVTEPAAVLAAIEEVLTALPA
jgi:pimeloyl-ACP methyl ester carboxylesterase